MSRATRWTVVALLAGLSCAPHATPPGGATPRGEVSVERPRDPLGEGSRSEPGYPKSIDVQVDLGPQLLTDSIQPPATPTCPPGQRCVDLALGAMEKRTLRLTWSGLGQYAKVVRALEPLSAPSHVLPSAADIRRQLGSSAKATLSIDLQKTNQTQRGDDGEVCRHWIVENVTLRIGGLVIPGWDGKGLELSGSASVDSPTTPGACPSP